jgi:hypothetical protein
MLTREQDFYEGMGMNLMGDQLLLIAAERIKHE